MSKEIRAFYTDTTIRVYQAYNDKIADSALANQRFVEPWSSTRMTWIKPSAIWMGYRSGWGHKDINQSRILALNLYRPMFDELLANAVPASAKENIRDVIVQWDPERTIGELSFEPNKNAYTSVLPETRSLQMGLSSKISVMLTMNNGPLLHSITDMTSVFNEIGHCLSTGMLSRAKELLSEHCSEQLYNY